MKIEKLQGNELDNRLDNLRYATPSENADDKKRHNTIMKGSHHTNSKSNEEQVAEIKTLLKEGNLTQTEIGERYNVIGGTIWSIRKGYTWKHVCI